MLFHVNLGKIYFHVIDIFQEKLFKKTELINIFYATYSLRHGNDYVSWRILNISFWTYIFMTYVINIESTTMLTFINTVTNMFLSFVRL